MAVASGGIAAQLAHARAIDPYQVHSHLRRTIARPIQLSSGIHRLLRHPSTRTFSLLLTQIFPQLLTSAARLTRVRNLKG
jgi:hypothetical protein